MIELRKIGCKVIVPPLDNETRWNSKFMMVRNFYNYYYQFEIIRRTKARALITKCFLLHIFSVS